MDGNGPGIKGEKTQHLTVVISGDGLFSIDHFVLPNEFQHIYEGHETAHLKHQRIKKPIQTHLALKIDILESLANLMRWC